MNIEALKNRAKTEGRFFVVSLFYLGLLIFILLFRAIDAEGYWLSILLLYMPQKFFLYPAIPILITSLVFRRFISSGISLLSIIIVILFFMQLKINAANFTKTDSNDIKIVTYNIRAGTFGAKKVADFLKSTDADLIFLQEARQTTRGDKPDPVPVIIRELDNWNYIRGGSGDELMILSRFPFTGYGEKKLGNFRKCLTGTVNIAGKETKVINVHFSTAKKGGSLLMSGIYFPEYLQHTADVRKEQTDALEEILRDGKPTIMAGDFNTPPGSKIHKSFKKHLTDCFNKKGSGFGLTFSSWKPDWRIDYIYVSRDFDVKNCRVIKSKTSDHLPVEAVVGTFSSP